MINATVSFDVVQSVEEMGLPLGCPLVIQEKIPDPREVPLQKSMAYLNKPAVIASVGAQSPKKRISRKRVQIEEASSPPQKTGPLHQFRSLAVELPLRIAEGNDGFAEYVLQPFLAF